MHDWRDRTKRIELGDRVGYSRQFLQSTGQFTGDVPRARGIVVGLQTLSEDCIIAQIEWDRVGLPEKVHVANLSTTRAIQRGD